MVQRSGCTPAIDGDTALIGASLDDDRGQWAGAAYVFSRDATGNWNQQAKLVATDGSEGDRFGMSVSTQKDRAIVSAPADDDNGAYSGAVYVFERSKDGAWVQQAKLLPSDTAEYREFGRQVSLDGEKVAIGANDISEDTGYVGGIAYVFSRNETGHWNEEARFPVAHAWEHDQNFGWSIQLRGPALLVGAKHDDTNGWGSGSAHLFVHDKSGDDWREVAKFLSSDGGERQSLGTSVGIEGAAVILGAPGDHALGQFSGAAYAFDASEFIPLMVEVEVDLRPSDLNNVLNPRSRGRFWVAIMSDENFDALQVDPSSVRMGAGGASPDRYRVRDSNGDGVVDLIVRFRTPKVGVVCGDTSVELTGHTYDGVEIVGEDDVRTVGCNKPRPKKKGKKE